MSELIQEFSNSPTWAKIAAPICIIGIAWWAWEFYQGCYLAGIAGTWRILRKRARRREQFGAFLRRLWRRLRRDSREVCPNCDNVLVSGMVAVQTTAYNSYGGDGHPESFDVPGLVCWYCNYGEGCHE